MDLSHRLLVENWTRLCPRTASLWLTPSVLMSGDPRWWPPLQPSTLSCLESALLKWSITSLKTTHRYWVMYTAYRLSQLHTHTHTPHTHTHTPPTHTHTTHIRTGKGPPISNPHQVSQPHVDRRGGGRRWTRTCCTHCAGPVCPAQTQAAPHCPPHLTPRTTGTRWDKNLSGTTSPHHYPSLFLILYTKFHQKLWLRQTVYLPCQMSLF